MVRWFRCLLKKICSVHHSCVCAVASGSKLHSAVHPAKLGHIGLGQMVPWNRRPPQEGSIDSSKNRFSRTPKGSIEPPFVRNRQTQLSQTQFDKITDKILMLGSFVPSLCVLEYPREFPFLYICIYGFSCRYLVQLGLPQLDLPVPNFGP